MVRNLLSLVVGITIVIFSNSSQAYDPEMDLDLTSINCQGTWENDSIAAYCESIGEIDRLFNVGTRYQYESFETISSALDADLEASYDMILMVNAAQGSKTSSLIPTGSFIPNQHMLVVQKPKGQKKMFKRNRQGTITGLAKGVKQLSEIIGQGPIDEVASYKKGGDPIQWNGLELVPVSTGASWHMLSFSGIFQVNWGRSKTNLATSYGAPMSNQLYFGYYYHSRGTVRQKWTNARRERVSYAAVHGTPKSNWGLLGKEQASHGCTRVHPALQKAIRGAALGMKDKDVIELDWDFNLGERDPNTATSSQKPVLLIVFEGYDSQSI